MPKKGSIQIKKYLRDNRNDLVDTHFVYSNIKFNKKENYFDVKLKYLHSRSKIEIDTNLDKIIKPGDGTWVLNKEIFLIEAVFTKDQEDPKSKNPVNVNKLSVLEIDLKVSPDYAALKDPRFYYQIIQKGEPFPSRGNVVFEKSKMDENHKLHKEEILVFTSDCDIIIPPPPPPRVD